MIALKSVKSGEIRGHYTYLLVFGFPAGVAESKRDQRGPQQTPFDN
jgi:hypothetical protein